jgi:hypothetical protein
MLRNLFYSGPSFSTLHEEYAKKGRIDDRAPVQTSGHIDIDSPVEQVWELLVDLPRWPAINPAFSDVQLEGAANVDVRFSFKLNNFPIKATLAVVDPCRQLTWTGLSLWFKAVDRHLLEPLPGGGTRLHMAESFSGILAPLFVTSARLRAQHDKSLAAFKRAVESGNGRR